MRMQKRPDAEEVRRTRDFYDWWAPFYDATNWLAARLRGASDSAERRKAVDQLGLAPGMRVLEVSCGTGTNLPLLRPWGKRGSWQEWIYRRGCCGVAVISCAGRATKQVSF